MVETLKQKCLEHGVVIEYGKEVSSVKDVGGAFDLVIGCDGARSNLRKELCVSQEFSKNKKLGSLLQIKFKAAGHFTLEKSNLSEVIRSLMFVFSLFSLSSLFGILVRADSFFDVFVLPTKTAERLK